MGNGRKAKFKIRFPYFLSKWKKKKLSGTTDCLLQGVICTQWIPKSAKGISSRIQACLPQADAWECRQPPHPVPRTRRVHHMRREGFRPQRHANLGSDINFYVLVCLRWVFAATWDLWVWPVNSQLSHVPDQGLNPSPLPWECGALATGPPEKPLGSDSEPAILCVTLSKLFNLSGPWFPHL